MAPEKLTILVLAANPDDTDQLKLDEEVRAIDRALREGEYRDRFELRAHWAVRVEDLQGLLLRYRPHVVHFAGHGSEGGEIVLMDAGRRKYLVPLEALASLFDILGNKPRCVVLNACYSDAQAQGIACAVDCVVGMARAVSDEAALDFAAGFYGGIAAGSTLAEAFALGRNRIELTGHVLAGHVLAGSAEEMTPRLLALRTGADRLWLHAEPRSTPRADFYHHVSLPPNYVHRAELLADLRQVLTANTRTPVAVTSAVTSAVPRGARMTAVHGMGGIGKTVAVRALCDDPAVQDAYPDGILWAAVGQTPDLAARLREWANVLGATVTQTAPTLDELRNAVAAALRSKACLLIADDVWHPEHLAAFRVGGAGCRLVITTRDAALATEAGATVQPVPLMDRAEAVALLEEWAGETLAATPLALKQQIVARVDYLPLALRLAGAQLRTAAPEAWLAAFDARQAGGAAAGERPRQPGEDA